MVQVINKIKNLIFQDVKNENETKKVAVILRLNSLLMCMYYVCLSIIFMVAGQGRLILLCVVCFLVFILPFYFTYINRTKLAVILTQLLILGSILVFVVEFGGDFGIHYFIYTMLILNFTTNYLSSSRKILVAIGLGIIQLIFQSFAGVSVIGQVLSGGAMVVLHVINTFYIFMTMVAALIFVSKESVEMESKLIRYNEKMQHLASVDPLTGLLNRRSMKEYLERQKKQCRDGSIGTMSIALGDIDFFKNVNDTYGHDCGDMVLKNMAEIFRQFMEDKGKVSRWGGEEFLLVFGDCNGDDALIQLTRLLSQIRKNEMIYKDQKIKVTMTFGLEEVNVRKSMEDDIHEADRKLYLGKDGGRNQIVY